MTTLSEIEKAIEAFNSDAGTFKRQREALVDKAAAAGLSRRHIAKVLATVTVRMPAGE